MKFLGLSKAEMRAHKNEQLKQHQRRKNAVKRQHMAERGCRDCPERDPVVLTLHHPDPEDKHPTLKKNGSVWIHLSWDDLFTEMEKCVVLCANCHLREEVRLRAEQ